MAQLQLRFADLCVSTATMVRHAEVLRVWARTDHVGLLADLKMVSEVRHRHKEVRLETYANVRLMNSDFIDTVIKYLLEVLSLAGFPNKITWELGDAEWPKHYFHAAQVNAVEDFRNHEDAAHVFHLVQTNSNCDEAFRVTIKRTFTGKQIRVLTVEFHDSWNESDVPASASSSSSSTSPTGSSTSTKRVLTSGVGGCLKEEGRTVVANGRKKSVQWAEPLLRSG